MPALLKTRWKKLGYNQVYDDYDIGRFRVFFGEFTAKGLMPKIAHFTNSLAEVAAMGLYQRKNTSDQVAQKFLEKYKEQNPTAPALSLDEFKELRKAKLRGMAAELRILLAFFGLIALGRGLLGDDDDDEDGKFLAMTAFRITQRGMFELSFFTNPRSATSLLTSPIPSIRLFKDITKVLNNTFDETRDRFIGEDSPYDRTPRFYYISKLIPGVSAGFDFIDFWGTYDPDRKAFER